MIRNTRIDMDSAIIFRRMIVVFHMSRLRIFSELWVIVGCAGRFHGSQGHSLDLGCPNSFGDQPIGFGWRLFEIILFEHDPKTVRDGFIERSGLSLITKVGGVLSDTMGEFMAD